MFLIPKHESFPTFLYCSFTKIWNERGGSKFIAQHAFLSSDVLITSLLVSTSRGSHCGLIWILLQFVQWQVLTQTKSKSLLENDNSFWPIKHSLPAQSLEFFWYYWKKNTSLFSFLFYLLVSYKYLKALSEFRIFL